MTRSSYRHHVAGMRVDPLTYSDAVEIVAREARLRRGSYVCVANVHMVMEAHDDPSFRDIVERALLVTPDGQPLVWTLRALGATGVERVYGPTLTLRLCEEAERTGLRIALYGGTPESLESFRAFLSREYPELQVACAISPPFRPPTVEEDERDTQEIAASGAHVVFVGIGCPKQERWMAAHRDRIPAVMVGVGAAFDFHSGRVRQAPAFLQRWGLEWLFRLVMEPRRLWKRYARHNPRFVVLAIHQWLRYAASGFRRPSAAQIDADAVRRRDPARHRPRIGHRLLPPAPPVSPETAGTRQSEQPSSES